MSGVKIIFNDLPKIAANYRSQAGKEVAKAAIAIEAQTKANIREQDLIDTGFMFNSVQAEPVQPFEWRVSVGAEYAPYHEYGTRHIPARPFFTPAISAIRPQFFANMERLVAQSN